MKTTTMPQRREGRIVAVLLTVLLLAPCSVHAKQEPTLGAKLVDAEQKAKKQTATVQVTVGGIRLVDPDSVQARAKAGEGHLHYQVDNGPVIATTATKLSFHNLGEGQHSLVVTLVGNDHNPVGSQETIAVVIP